MTPSLLLCCSSYAEAIKTCESPQYAELNDSLLCVIPTSTDNLFIFSLYNSKHSGGGALVQLVEALSYKPEGSGFGSRCCHWNILLTSFRPHYGPGVDSASNRNECSPVTGLEWPRGLQEVKVPRFHDNGTGWW